MAVEDNNKDIMNINDPLDINELAALNDDISPEFIEQLQNQITQNSNLIEKKPQSTDVTTLFEEVSGNPEGKNNSFVAKLDDSIDDNFIKKYKAKIEKQKNAHFEEMKEKEEAEKKARLEAEKAEQEAKKKAKLEAEKNAQLEVSEKSVTQQPKKNETASNVSPTANTELAVTNTEPIESLTNGNIIEKPVSQEQIEYNESLDLLDDNIKYSKYVIYIDPENREFIESLTVKERKNLINRILKEQDNIVITQKRLNIIQTYIKHAIIAILTVAIATPIIYYTINAALEATVNNHRRSQTIFKTLYKEKEKLSIIITN